MYCCVFETINRTLLFNGRKCVISLQNVWLIYSVHIHMICRNIESKNHGLAKEAFVHNPTRCFIGISIWTLWQKKWPSSEFLILIYSHKMNEKMVFMHCYIYLITIYQNESPVRKEDMPTIIFNFQFFEFSYSPITAEIRAFN